jgi:hypothetical protein
MKPQAFDFSSPCDFDPRSACIAPSKDQEARETSALAAIENTATGRRAKQNATLLTLIRAAGEQGISDIELARATGFPRASICARRGWDLRSLIEPAAARYIDPVSKRGFTRWKLKAAV